MAATHPAASMIKNSATPKFSATNLVQTTARLARELPAEIPNITPLGNPQEPSFACPLGGIYGLNIITAAEAPLALQSPAVPGHRACFDTCDWRNWLSAQKRRTQVDYIIEVALSAFPDVDENQLVAQAFSAEEKVFTDSDTEEFYYQRLGWIVQQMSIQQRATLLCARPVKVADAVRLAYTTATPKDKPRIIQLTKTHTDIIRDRGVPRYETTDMDFLDFVNTLLHYISTMQRQEAQHHTC